MGFKKRQFLEDISTYIGEDQLYSQIVNGRSSSITMVYNAFGTVMYRCRIFDHGEFKILFDTLEEAADWLEINEKGVLHEPYDPLCHPHDGSGCR